MSDRTDRLDELLREEISRVISREVDDPRVGFVTVTSVKVAPDLRHATVWVSIIGQPDERREAVHVLGRAMPFVRSRLHVLRLRRIPELHLRLDDSLERGTRVLQIIQEAVEGEPAGSGPEPSGETLPTPVGRPPVEPRRPRRRPTHRTGRAAR